MLYDRGYTAKGCDLFLSLHSNAVGNGIREDIDYVVAYVAVNGKADKIATLLTRCVAATMETKERPRIEKKYGSNGDYYGVIRGATAAGVPGLILEHSFHTNTRSTNWFLNDSNFERLARAEAQTIAEYFSILVEVPPLQPDPDPDTSKWYRIRKSWSDPASQKGSFESLELAKKACLPGYTVYDWNGKAVYSPAGIPSYPYVGKCTANGVNVRKGPGMGYGTIKNWPKLNKDNLVDVQGKTGAWYHILIAKKYEGYIFEDYIQKV